MGGGGRGSKRFVPAAAVGPQQLRAYVVLTWRARHCRLACAAAGYGGSLRRRAVVAVNCRGCGHDRVARNRDIRQQRQLCAQQRQFVHQRHVACRRPWAMPAAPFRTRIRASNPRPSICQMQLPFPIPLTLVRRCRNWLQQSHEDHQQADVLPPEPSRNQRHGARHWLHVRSRRRRHPRVFLQAGAFEQRPALGGRAGMRRVLPRHAD